jgi:signal transduction histidine kinase
MKYCLFLLFIFFAAGSLSQGLTDSLLTAFANMKDDTAKVNKMNQIAITYKNTVPKTSVEVATQTVVLADRLKYQKGGGEAYNIIGMANFNMGLFSEAKEAHEKAKVLFEQVNEKSGLATAIFNIGNVYYKQGNLPAALDTYIKTAKVFEEMGDQVKVAKTYNNIALLYRKQGNLELSLKYHNLVLKSRLAMNDQVGLASTYNNLGSVSWEKKDHLKSIEYYKMAIALQEKANDLHSMATTYNNIGISYRDMKRYDEALVYYTKSLSINSKIPDKNGMAISYIDIGTVYETKKLYDEAIAYHRKGLALAEEIGNKDIIQSAHVGLASAYSGAKQFQKAFEELQMQDKIKDSLNNKDTRRAIAEMQTKFETEKQEKEITILNQEKKLKEVVLREKDALIAEAELRQVIIIGSALVLLVLAYLLYNRNKLRQKQLIDAEIINQQTIRSKAIIEAEEKERIRIAKDLHDGIGQQLSAVKMHFSAFESSLTFADDEQRKQMQSLIDMVDESVKEVRSISHNMMPNALIRWGLATAVREFVNKISISDSLQIDLQIDGLNERLENTVETVLYRVLQECVSNIIKHAHASRVSIQLIKHEHSLNLMLEDNGVGFDSNKLNDFAGIGLKNIISRVEYLSGTVEFDSMVGKGTTVVVDIPL